ncbi:hypothetical protein Y032_0018g3483 [Ancylostoma ceylanicum]|uniref:BPTI/Kunitz inhibitor domain-containing protein n=1 Tax=Ancylostoma ceylanicum TaxID=53326 RepID=A0A016V2L7_9BILA|nr:hypothetical protein Y032_0018g3483 [Ancylostoma ceylanicum]
MRWQNLCALILQITSMFALITPGTAVNCQLPRDKGYSCDEPERTMFYFDMRMGVCQPMMHRGCGGNENKFDSAAKCKEQCIEKKGKAKPSAPASKGAGLVVEECKLPTDAKIPDVAKSCDNGCDIGYACNKNNKCCPMKDYICSLPASSGSETRTQKHYGRYVYQRGLSNCIRFSYFGTGGNFNNFKTYNDCKNFCMEKPK